MKRSLLSVALGVAVAAIAWGVPPSVTAAEQPAATPRAEQPKQRQFSGTITSIEAAGSSFTVKGTLGSRTFKLASDANITAAGKSGATLEDLKVGDRVEVSYSEAEGVMMAHRIEATAKGAEAK